MLDTSEFVSCLLFSILTVLQETMIVISQAQADTLLQLFACNQVY